MGYGAWEGGVHDGVSLCFFRGHRRAGGACTVCGYAAVVERASDSTRASPRERFVCFFSRAGISAPEHRGGIMGSWRYCWTREFVNKEKVTIHGNLAGPESCFFKERKKLRLRFLCYFGG